MILCLPTMMASPITDAEYRPDLPREADQSIRMLTYRQNIDEEKRRELLMGEKMQRDSYSDCIISCNTGTDQTLSEGESRTEIRLIYHRY
jgi:hypothetical protein